VPHLLLLLLLLCRLHLHIHLHLPLMTPRLLTVGCSPQHLTSGKA
jgi:hypothetical protein